MVVNLLNLIEENTDQMYDQGRHFQEYLVNKGIYEHLTFSQAIE